MAKKRKRKAKSIEELNEENELLKLKLMAEFGGDFGTEDDIPPQVENAFLKQIRNFHKQHGNAEVTTLYKFIGEPEYNHVHDMSERQIKAALRKMLKLMKKNGVELDILAPTPDREIYRFITEELFKEEIEGLRMRGWTTKFIYEDFHPNAEFDVKTVIHNALMSMFDAQAPFMHDYFAEDMKDHLGLSTDAEELHQKVEKFKTQFNDVLLVNYDYIKIDVDKETGTAHAVIDVHYKTQKEKGRRTKRELTTVDMYLECSNLLPNWWEVSSVYCELF